MARFFRQTVAGSGRERFFRFDPADGVEAWTGEKWNEAPGFFERVFTDPDFEEVDASALPADVSTEA